MEDLSSSKIGVYLQGKSAIVTGGSIRIGAAIALKLAECGANVALLGAIANAVADTIGARVFDLPITPQRVLEAIQAKKEILKQC